MASIKKLALDLGLKTGWAILWEDGRRTSGVWDNSGGDEWGARYNKLDSHLDYVGQAYGQIKKVVYEMPSYFRSGDANRSVYGMLGVVDMFCADFGIPSSHYYIGTIKKHATGSGKATKADMVNSANKAKWVDHVIMDHNEADALWILDLSEKIDKNG